MFFYHFSSVIFIILLLFIKLSTSQDEFCNLESDCSNGVFKNIEIKTFADPNRHLRLNISWDEPLGNFDSFLVNIETADSNCYIPSSCQNSNVNNSFLIEPNMKMEHPADKPSHRCKYEFFFSADEKNGSCFRETVDYTVPDCVDTVCHCEAGSPYNLTNIEEISDKTFEISFSSSKRDLNVSLESVFNQIWYTRKDSTKHITKIHHDDIIFDGQKKSLKFSSMDVFEGSFYIFHVDLYLDDCTYHFKKEVRIKVPEKPHNSRRYIIYGVPSLGLMALLVIYLLRKRWPKIIQKFRNHLPFLPRVPDDMQIAPKINVLLNEVENVQYVPLDFIDHVISIDQYEIPRNKIIIKTVIGSGSFGKVYKCDFYPMDSTKCTLAAAKMPIENAPEEELADFLSEIKIMKKITEHGGHQNVIKLVACVTSEKPYVMVMELVPCGSLKMYLTNLRKEWEKRKKNWSRGARIGPIGQRHFFPDNMVVESYLSPTGVEENGSNKNNGLKYSSIQFQDHTTSSSTGSESYVTPDGLRTPSTPGSPLTPAAIVHIPSTIEEYQDRKQLIPIVKISSSPALNELRRKSSGVRLKTESEETLKPQSNYGAFNLPSPNSSVTSSGLPSCTETLLTPLDLESPIHEGKLIDLTPPIRPVLDTSDLQNFALQLANGMAFLESIDVTHRDLAARNILINDQKVLKISDFGMARVGVYINNPQKRQPLRWMAPEAIEERKCDTKTDVWSFGVVLWEIGSLGAFPYGNLSNDLVLVHIRQGKRLERPEMCTDRLYTLMRKCWSKEANQRPTFNEIAKSLDENSGKIYVDFDQISPKYVFPPVHRDEDG